MFEFLQTQSQRLLKELFGDTHVPILWQRPLEASHGDMSTSFALQLGKKMNKNPRELAEVFAEKLKTLPEIEKTEVAGAAFVNVWLTPSALLRETQTVESFC